MNERFQQLLKQSTNPPWDGELGAANEFNLEKFSELIVLECVRYLNEDYQRDFDTLWREDLSKSIKYHFGVKE